MEQSRCATGMNASSTKIWCCGRAWSRPQRQGRTASLSSTEEPSLPRTIRGGKAMRKEESSCCWIARKCQHSLGPPPPLRPKRAAQTAAQGCAPAEAPTTAAKQKKGDTSNEVKRGTFLTRLDTLCEQPLPKAVTSSKMRLMICAGVMIAALQSLRPINICTMPIDLSGMSSFKWSDSHHGQNNVIS